MAFYFQDATLLKRSNNSVDLPKNCFKRNYYQLAFEVTMWVYIKKMFKHADWVVAYLTVSKNTQYMYVCNLCIQKPILYIPNVNTPV